MRKPIQITTAIFDYEPLIYVLCDDGSIWLESSSMSNSERTKTYFKRIDCELSFMDDAEIAALSDSEFKKINDDIS